MKLLLEVFIVFFKLGCFSFGGGYAAIPLIEKEVVQNKKWLEQEKIIDIFAVSQALPGAIALNSSAFVGYSIAGIPGAIAALLGNLVPSVFIVFLLISLFVQYSNHEMVKSAFLGIRPTIVALIAYAAYKMGKTAIKDKVSCLIALAAFCVVMFVPQLPIPLIIVSGAIVGILLLKVLPIEVK